MDVAWVEEQEGRDAQGRARLLGLFTGRLERARDEESRRVEIERLEDVAIDDAIGWGRARAGLVLVRFGRRSGFWSAGATPHWIYPAWPPHDLPPLVERPAVEADWETGEPVHWSVTFWLRPDDLADDVRLDVASGVPRVLPGALHGPRDGRAAGQSAIHATDRIPRSKHRASRRPQRVATGPSRRKPVGCEAHDRAGRHPCAGHRRHQRARAGNGAGAR